MTGTQLYGLGLVGFAAVAMVAVSAGSAQAQVFDQFVGPNVAGTGVEPDVTVLSRRRPDYDYVGMHLGTFTVQPELTTSTGYDSNVLGTSKPKGSSAVETAGTVAALSNWSRDSLGATLSFDNTRYLDVPNQSTLNWTLATLGTINIGQDLATLGYSHALLSQSPRDLDTPQLDRTITFSTDTFRTGYTTKFNRLSLSPEFDVEIYRFENGTVAGVPFPQSFRDRTSFTPGLIATYELAPLRNLVAVVRNTVADYVTPTPGALTRNYNDAAFLAGFDYNDINTIRLRVLVGYETRSFTSTALKTIQAPVAEVTAIYNISDLTTLTATLARQVADAAEEDTNGYTVTNLKLTLDHEYLRNVLLQARAAASVYQSAGSNGTSEQYSSGINATWLLNQNVRLSAAYDLIVRSATTFQTAATVPSANVGLPFGGNYVDNQYMLHLSLGF